jgi:hypothetical protein
MPRIIYCLFFYSVLVVSLSGCAVSPTYVDDAKLTKNEANNTPINPVHYKIEEGFKARPPQCIAVLPLIHISDQKGNEKKPSISSDDLEQLRWSLYSQLAPYPYRDVELASVNQAIASVGSTENLKGLGKALNCDAFLLSEVTNYSSGFFAVYSQASIGIKMRLIRAKNGELLWEGSHVARSHGGSVPLSPIGFIMGLYEASENLSDEQLVRVKDDVFRRLLSTWTNTQNMTIAKAKPEIEKIKLKEVKEESYLSYVSAYSLWLREGPGRKYPKKGILKHKDELEVVDETYSPWVQVRVADGQLGYVNSKYLNSF